MGTSTGNFPAVDVLRARVAGEAAGVVTEQVIGKTPPYAGAITAVRYSPDTVVTGAATNYKSINIKNRGTDAAGSGLPASIIFIAGVNAPAFDETAVTLHTTVSTRDVVANSILTFFTGIAGTGMALPAGLIEVEITRD